MKRWPMWAGIAYTVLSLAAILIVPAAPEASASGATVVRYYRDHADALHTVTWLIAVSLVPLALLLAHLRSLLLGTARDVFLFGGAGLLATFIVWSWFGAGLALHPNNLDPRTARTLSDVAAYFGPILTLSIVLVIVPIGVAAWRRDYGLGRGLAWLTLVFALEQSIETITIFGKRGFIAPGGPMNFILGAGLFLAWIVTAGVMSSTTEVRRAASSGQVRP